MRQKNSNTQRNEGQEKLYHHLGPILQCLNHRLISFIKIYKNLNYVLANLGWDCSSVAFTSPREQSATTYNNISTLANKNQLLASLVKENYHPQSDSAMDVVCNNTDKLGATVASLFIG